MEYPRQHGIPHWHGIPPLTQNSPIDTEFPRRHGISLSTRNSPIDTEFRRHRIPSTRNSVDTEFRWHGIPPIFFLLPYIQYAILCYLFLPNSDGISRILRASLYNMYEFEYFMFKFVRIKSKISGLPEVKSASFFLILLIANPLISTQNQSANLLIFS
jgi:hypothetical protein